MFKNTAEFVSWGTPKGCIGQIGVSLCDDGNEDLPTQVQTSCQRDRRSQESKNQSALIRTELLYNNFTYTGRNFT